MPYQLSYFRKTFKYQLIRLRPLSAGSRIMPYQLSYFRKTFKYQLIRLRPLSAGSRITLYQLSYFRKIFKNLLQTGNPYPPVVGLCPTS